VKKADPRKENAKKCFPLLSMNQCVGIVGTDPSMYNRTGSEHMNRNSRQNPERRIETQKEMKVGRRQRQCREQQGV